ncbi:MAG: hypothetical protein QM820_32790 [Minicystis sp.]
MHLAEGAEPRVGDGGLAQDEPLDPPRSFTAASAVSPAAWTSRSGNMRSVSPTLHGAASRSKETKYASRTTYHSRTQNWTRRGHHAQSGKGSE